MYISMAGGRMKLAYKAKKSVAKKALTIANRNASALKRARDNNDIKTTGQAVGSDPIKYLINGLETGAGEGKRIGNSISINSLKLTSSFKISEDAEATIVRLILVYDKGADNAVFTNADLLTVTSSPDNMYSFFRTDTSKRFRVVFDRLYNLSKNGVQSRTVKWSKKYKQPLVAKYSANNGTIADIETGSLYLMVLSDDNTNKPVFSFTLRLVYEK